MKQIITRKLFSLTAIAAIIGTQFAFAMAQQPETSAGFESLHGYPSNFNLSKSSEAQAAYDSMTEQQKAETRALVEQLIADAPSPEAYQPQSLDLTLVDDVGGTSNVSSDASKAPFSGFYNKTAAVPAPEGEYCAGMPGRCWDYDGDGLSDKLEVGLADGFTPRYHVSAGENSGTGFATFQDNENQQLIQSVFGSTPPISHYRVKPLGVYTRIADGLQYGLIQINYMTLWNRDDGLPLSAFCGTLTPLFNIDPIQGSHALDNEWAAVLVAAPVVNGTYDTVKANYKMYEVFTSAHRGKGIFDTSMYYNLSTPFPIDSHIRLYLAKSKHGTYGFNPNFFPIIPPNVILSVYAGLANYYYVTGNYVGYIAGLSIAFQLFFGCVVERFQDQGGLLADANKRFNVGELIQPMPNMRFIKTSDLSQQLGLTFY